MYTIKNVPFKKNVVCFVKFKEFLMSQRLDIQ